jgi:RND superfamily putative drug exporter
VTASFRATVSTLQDGHAGSVVGGFLDSGRLEVTTPILMFCIAFGPAN